MMTVRFPDGISVQYNTANWVTRAQHGYCDLYTKENGSWIAQVPVSAIVEAVPACQVYKAAKSYEDNRLAALEKEMRSLKRAVKAAIKK